MWELRLQRINNHGLSLKVPGRGSRERGLVGRKGREEGGRIEGIGGGGGGRKCRGKGKRGRRKEKKKEKERKEPKIGCCLSTYYYYGYSQQRSPIGMKQNIKPYTRLWS